MRKLHSRRRDPLIWTFYKTLRVTRERRKTKRVSLRYTATLPVTRCFCMNTPPLIHAVYTSLGVRLLTTEPVVRTTIHLLRSPWSLLVQVVIIKGQALRHPTFAFIGSVAQVRTVSYLSEHAAYRIGFQPSQVNTNKRQVYSIYTLYT
jgi:hypothetical protein